MLKKLAGRRLASTLGPLPPMIVAVPLLQVLFGMHHCWRPSPK